jgi:hypothetical protein
VTEAGENLRWSIGWMYKKVSNERDDGALTRLTRETGTVNREKIKK